MRRFVLAALALCVGIALVNSQPRRQEFITASLPPREVEIVRAHYNIAASKNEPIDAVEVAMRTGGEMVAVKLEVKGQLVDYALLPIAVFVALLQPGFSY